MSVRIELINGECASEMLSIPDESIDLVVTSPPYDTIRAYNGFVFDFEKIANQLFRVLKKGGVCVWIVADETKDFKESTTSFLQALYFCKIGFGLLDTMIYAKENVPPTYPNMKRYAPAFEFMFVFSKGKPNTFNPIKDRKNKEYGTEKHSTTQRQKNGDLVSAGSYTPTEYGIRFNVWSYHVGKNKDTKDVIALKHPARFPESLAHDHILSWSNPGDTVLDPMMGSGTTGKMAKLLNRNFIGIEISEKYMEIAEKRMGFV